MRNIIFAFMIAASLVSVSQFPVASASGPCRLDKIGTWSEINNAGTQTIEVGGGGFSHYDLYPARGAKTISYITERVGRVGTYAGYGSAWEGANLDDCGQWSQFDWVGDAANYQRGRGPDRGSGLVVNVNVRDEANYLVVHANVFCRPEAEIRQIAAEHTAAWRFDNPNPIVWVFDELRGQCGWGGSTPAPQPAPMASGPACNPATKLPDLVSKPNAPARIESGHQWLIVNGWSNWTNPNIGDHSFVVPPGEVIDYKGGGSVWARPENCMAETMAEFNSSPITCKPTLAAVRAANFDARTSADMPRWPC